MTQPTDETQAALAEWGCPVECGESTCTAKAQAVDGTWIQTDCVDCHSTGQRYLLRRECYFAVETDPGGNDYYFCADCLEPEECLPSCHCAGLGYVFNDDPDAIIGEHGAIRAKGWAYKLTSGEKYDAAYIWTTDSLPHYIGTVTTVEGHFGMAAIQLALLRAVRKVNDGTN